MKKLFTTICATIILLFLFTTTSFAMVSNPSSFTISAYTDEERYSNNLWITKILSQTSLTGTSIYLKIGYDGYGSNFVNVNNHTTSFTEISTEKKYRWGEWVGYDSIIMLENFTPGNYIIEAGRLPYQGVNVPKKSISVNIQ